ncbi:hypothetical protein DERP_010802 [Dermatophagoides pteronyssinus]|uniref:Uncharacterized protein n=1 Tax=Dermatophagoides pteronyssinus TaxID=6956 RepID=A0ABQ8J6T7_DERPT|nr:hypothetical protein DERP_010802 [Dermatophagoides pteronyssinus]
MSTSSPPSSSIHNNDDDDHNNNNNDQSDSPIIMFNVYNKKDQSPGSILPPENEQQQQQQQSSSIMMRKNSPASSISYQSGGHYPHHHNHQHQQQQRQSKNNGLSPRIPRKPMTNNEIGNNHKPILSSPSIVITGSQQSSIQNPINDGSSQQQQHSNRNQQLSSIDDIDYPDFDHDDDDDDVGDCSPRARMIPKDSVGSNWIRMDDYQQQQQQKNIGKNSNDQHVKNDNNNKIDVSLFTTKKNVAQGMLDIALLSANCSQLKYLLYHYERDVPIASSSSSSPSSSSSMQSINHRDTTWATMFTGTNTGSLDFYFATNLICISISIFLQIIIGILLILNSRHNVYIHRYQRVADSYSNWILLAVFIVTVVNIFLSVFISAR